MAVGWTDKAERVIQAFDRLRAEGRDGFTLDADGNEVQREAGYAVAIYESSARHIAALITDPDFLPVRYLGYWRDENGKEYTDLVRIVDDIDVARHYGKEYEQVAFYDFANKEAVYV